MSRYRSAGIGVLSLPDGVRAVDPNALDPAHDGGEVRGNVARGNGFDPDPGSGCLRPMSSREWLVERS